MHLIWSFILIIPGIVYAVYIYSYFKSWREIPQVNSKDTKFFPSVSIVIPARNESERLADCLQSIQKQLYPKNKVEIIVVDDHSTDDTLKIASTFTDINSFTLNQHESGKKAALKKGIQHASGEIILCTDADTVRGNEWIKILVAAFENSNIQFVTAPVLYKHKSKNLLQSFQYADILAMAGITGAAIQRKKPEMANGANMAFRKTFFEQANGFEGTKNTAGGDDIFLLLKAFRQNEKAIQYIKNPEAIVFTYPETNISDFLNQRKRWISKTSKLPGLHIFLTLVCVYLFHLYITALFIYSWFSPLSFIVFLFTLTVKILSDYNFVKIVSRDLKEASVSFPGFIIVQLLHIVYVLWGGLASFLKTKLWKGRKFE